MTTTERRRPLVHSPTEVRRRRIIAGLGQEELAKRARISWPYLSLIESGKRSPGVEVLHRLAEALSCPVEEILASPEDVADPIGDVTG